jgi:dTDP-4-dehydrorhamnose 3,5-epimerase
LDGFIKDLYKQFKESINMEVIKTAIDGVLIIEPKVFGDKRGYFFESFSQREFDVKVAPILGHTINFVQDNESMSSYGVMRGLHFQRPPYTQSKLVRCVKGAVLDVAVDIRKGSPTYGQHVAVELIEDNHRQFLVPRGFAHGFAVLSETAVFKYKCDVFYHSEADGGISIIDDSLGIDWRIPTDKANLSDKDTKHALLRDFDSPFDIKVSLY